MVLPLPSRCLVWIPFTVSTFHNRNGHLSWKDRLDELNYVSYYRRSQVFIAPFFFDRVKCDGLEKISNNKVKIILDQGQ